ncbi:MAG: two-component regulator propeller domain-containing protein [Sphaerochaetaceae bacterium]
MEKDKEKSQLAQAGKPGFSVVLSAVNKFFVAVLLLCIVDLAFGQSTDSPLYFDRIMSENTRIEKGLSQNTVNSILQDSDGFMWFGTWDGLNRYDGYEFLIYNKEHGLSNQSISSIHQKGDTLWIGTEEGLNLLEISTNRITSFLNDENDSTSLSNNWINHIYEDHKGTLWISTASGLSLYRPATNNFEQVFSRDYGNPLRSNHMNMVKQDSSNNFWIATSYGLVYYEIKTQSLNRYFHIEADSTSLPDNDVTSIAFDSYNRMWVGTKSGLARFNNEKKAFFYVDLPELQSFDQKVEIMSLNADASEGLWIGTNGRGLFYLDFKTGQINSYINEPNRSYSLSDNRIHCIYIGNNDNIWAGTFNGLNMLNKDAAKFRTYRHYPQYKNSLSNNSVWTFLEVEPGIFWIGTDVGISIFNKAENSYDFIRMNPDKQNSLTENLIRCLYKSHNGTIWIGTRNKGLNAYNPKTKKITQYKSDPKNPASLPNGYIIDVQEDAAGNLWIATDDGLGILDEETGLFLSYHLPAKTGGEHVYDILLDSKKQLWFASSQGLLKYKAETDDFELFTIPEEMCQQDEMLTNKFFSITESKEGVFWIGTRGGGLVKFQPENFDFKVFTEKDGLPNNVVYEALVDKSGIVWLTTNWGLSRFNPDQLNFTNYDVTDGIQSNEFNLNAAIYASDGEILVGGMNGFNAFYPDEIVVNTEPPLVRITAFKKFNVLQSRNLRNGDSLFLNFSDNYFAFEFAALDFTNPQKNKYRYTLENYNTSWIERSANKRFAEYAKVSPGTYRFRLIASNSDGYWNTEGTSLTIIIKPAWFHTWLFRVGLLVLVVFIIYSLVFIRMRNIRRKHTNEKKYLAFEKQMYQLEQKALQLQMNPHFLFNALNSIQSFVVNNDIDNAIHYLSKFSQLMRRTLSNSRESAITLREELQALRLYVEIESLRFHGKFSYSIELDPEIDDGFMEIPPMILQPYVENAILHGLMHSKEIGNLKIALSLQGDSILCVIEDDGIGRTRAAEIRRESGIERKSQGMLITKERLDMLNQYTQDIYTVNVIDLVDDNGKPKGTRVEIRIHYKE